MKKYLIAFALCGPLFAAPPPKPASRKQPDIVATVSAADLSRSLIYNDREIPTIHAQLHYTTVFVLPKSEKIMDLVCGHNEDWTINGADGTNFAYVKPEKAGARTNLNLVTASGNVYSFLIAEGDANPDLKVFVETKDSTMLASMVARPKWIMASELDAVKREAGAAKAEAAAAKAEASRKLDDVEVRADREISSFRSSFPSSLKYDYAYRQKEKQRVFGMRAMAHSKEFTYIWADSQETPALYELKDGKPSLINFEYASGVYIVPKVVNAGYLAIGKQKLEFRREGE